MAQPLALDTLIAPSPAPFAGFSFDIDATRSPDGTLRLVALERYRFPDGAVYILAHPPGAVGWSVEDSLGNRSSFGGFGSTVAFVEGATSPLAALSDAGEVSLWRRDSTSGAWAFETLLRGIDKPGIGQAGFGAAIDGALLASGEELLFIGANNGGDRDGTVREGSAYAFRRDPATPPGPDAWVMEARLLVEDGVVGDGFGINVALLPTPGLPGGHPGDALVLAAANGEDRLRGTVHVLVRDGATRTWAFQDTLRPADSQEFDSFGRVSVASLPGGAPGEVVALIGANNVSDLAPRAGAAYAFRRERVPSAPADSFRWVEEAKLYPARPGLGLDFGQVTALALDTLGGVPVAVGLVGSDPSGETGSFPSEASLFVRTVAGGAPVWTRRAAYATGAKGPQEADWFGYAVDLAPAPEGGLLAFVGAYYSNVAQQMGYPQTGEAAGAVFVYDSRVTVASEPDAPVGPSAALHVFPNPLRDRMAVRLAWPEPGQARLTVTDMLGRTVAVLHEGALGTGTHQWSLAARGLAPGTYLLVLDGAAGRETRTFTVVR